MWITWTKSGSARQHIQLSRTHWNISHLMWFNSFSSKLITGLLSTGEVNPSHKWEAVTFTGHTHIGTVILCGTNMWNTSKNPSPSWDSVKLQWKKCIRFLSPFSADLWKNPIFCAWTKDLDQPVLCQWIMWHLTDLLCPSQESHINFSPYWTSHRNWSRKPE